MGDLTEQLCTVELEDDDFRTQNVESYSIASNYLLPTDEWDIVVYDHADPASLRRRFLPWKRIRIYIDGELQVLGRIDWTEGVGDSSSALRVHGRDYVAELVDGGADPAIAFKENQDLGDALLSIAGPFGIKTLVGSWNLTRNLLTGKIPHVGEPTRSFKTAKMSDFSLAGKTMGAFEAMDQIVARHGYTIQMGGQRDTLAVVEPLFGQSPSYELIKGEQPLVSGTARRDWTDVPSVTIAVGRRGMGNIGQRIKGARSEYPSIGNESPNEAGRTDEALLVGGLSPSSPGPVAEFTRLDWKRPFPMGLLYKPMFYEDKDSNTREQLERALRRELSRRMKNTLTYTCSARGHRHPSTGCIYTIDTVGKIRDDNEDVHENMWMLERTLVNEGRGPMTHMQWIRAGSIAL